MEIHPFFNPMPHFSGQIAIIGAGAVGTALAHFLTQAHFRPFGIVSRHLADARRLAQLLDVPHYSDQPHQIATKADLIFITTPDAQIRSVCECLAEKSGIDAHHYVAHCSGLLTHDALESARQQGAACFSFHPLAAFSRDVFPPRKPEPFYIALEGTERGVSLGHEIAAMIGAIPFEIESALKPLYHAGAVMAGNYLVSLFDAACLLAKGAGISEENAKQFLISLIKQSVSNLEDAVSPAKALSGPIKRGDVDTVRTHLRVLQQHCPELFDLYVELGKHTCRLAAAPNSEITAFFKGMTP